MGISNVGMLLKAKAWAGKVRLGSNDAAPPVFIRNLWKPESDKC